MTSFTLQPLTSTDVPNCITLYYAAFHNAHSHGCWPRIPSITAWWQNMIATELTEPGAHWLKAIDTQTGAMAGFGKWVEPKPGVLPDTELPEWPEGADKALCDETFGAWAREHRALMGGRGHWYLEMLAVDPKFQGRGAGSMMLRWGLEQADAGEWEAYLEASPEAVPLYKKLGFREAGKVDTLIDNERVKSTWYTNLFMIRSAANANAR